MSKIDLTDVTFLIQFRNDSKERVRNLLAVLSFIKKHFNTTIMVLECDKSEQIYDELIDVKLFFKDDSIFYRTKYYNIMTKRSSTPFLVFWDVDVLVHPLQIIEGVNLLRNQMADMVLPFDGRCFNVDPLISKLYHSKYDLNILTVNENKFRYMYGSFTVGGIFMVNKLKYTEAGMENENFFAWGPEDQERMKRWEILGYKVRKIDGAIYHLYHPRGINSGNFSVESNISLKKEFCKVCKMSRTELREYIDYQFKVL